MISILSFLFFGRINSLRRLLDKADALRLDNTQKLAIRLRRQLPGNVHMAASQRNRSSKPLVTTTNQTFQKCLRRAERCVRTGDGAANYKPFPFVLRLCLAADGSTRQAAKAILLVVGLTTIEI